jgi:hypothetical protein
MVLVSCIYLSLPIAANDRPNRAKKQADSRNAVVGRCHLRSGLQIWLCRSVPHHLDWRIRTGTNFGFKVLGKVRNYLTRNGIN